MLRAAPALVLGALVAGILVGGARGSSDALVLLGCAAFAAIVALTCRRSPSGLVALVVVAALFGAAGMQRALHGLVDSPLRAAVEAREDVTMLVTLVEDPDASRFASSALVRVRAWAQGDRVPSGDAGGRRVVASARGDAAMRFGLLAAGESATVRGWVAPLDGYDRRQQWRHAVATLHVLAVVDVASAHEPLMVAANRVRALVLSGSHALAPTDRALLAGLVLGDTRALPPMVEEQFRAAGLSHLTAVSGGNVAFVLALVAPVLRRLRLGGRLVASVGVLVLFGTMTRWEPSVSRAIVMGLFALVAGYLGRPTAGLRLVLVAATALLLIDPFLLHSVGFLLSCGACVGIALFARPIQRRLRGPHWMREVLAVTAAAQFGVAPVLIPVFGSMPLVALPANLIAVPLAAPLTMWGIASGLLSAGLAPALPAVPRVLAIPTAALLHALLAVADIASRVPIQLDARTFAAVTAAVAMLAAARVASRVSPRWRETTSVREG